jgi:anti-sigma factor ChrR (cupin superfamily)
MATATTPRSRIIPLADLAWQERQPGVRLKTIWEHPETRRWAAMARLAPDAKLPRHRHVGDELVFVIEGAISDEFGTVTAGNVGYRPHGCVHAVSAPNGATLLGIVTGGIEPATEPSGAMPSRVFTPSDLPWIETRPGVRQKRIWADEAGERRLILAQFEPGATLPRHRHVGDELISSSKAPTPTNRASWPPATSTTGPTAACTP